MFLKRLNIRKIAVVTLLTAFFMTSCVDEDVTAPGTDGDNSTSFLRLTTSPTMSRDSHYEDDPYAEQPESKREEAINRIDLFFFTDKDDVGQAFYTYEVNGAKRYTTADLTLRVPEEYSQIFTDNNVYVYALINLPSDIRVNTTANTIGNKEATMANLQQVWVSSPELTSQPLVDNFVMRGGNFVKTEIQGKDIYVTGSIMIERLASKVRLWTSIPEKIYIDKDGQTITRNDGETEADWKKRAEAEAYETWESAPTNPNGESNVRLYFYNATTNGRIDAYIGDDNNTYDLGYSDVDRNSRDEVIRRLNNTNEGLNAVDVDANYPWTHNIAYYSYPNKWDSKTPTEEHQTFVIVSVPWRRVTGSSNGVFENCYYQVPVNAIESNDIAADQLDPNHYYRIKLKIGMLGSKDLGSPLPVDASYEVVEWNNVPVDVDIKDRRYLVVNKKDWVMNNVHTISIPFSTSHKTIVEKCYVTFFRYYDPWGTDPWATFEYCDKINKQDNIGYVWDDVDFHESKEYDEWYAAAQSAGVLDDEGEIWRGNEMMYYKKKYLYDDVKNKFMYYVGREQPKTIQPDFKDINPDSPNFDASAWSEYNTRYENIDAVYTCEIDDEESVINFSHPLIQWELDGTGNDRCYNPVMNPGLQDEYSRCEITIKIRHEDWTQNELYHETVRITQYPGLYVEVEHNYGSPYHESPGNIYVLANNSQGNGLIARTNPRYVLAGSNNNPNMYIIHTTHLSTEDQEQFIVGDPRAIYFNNVLNTTFIDGNPPTQIPLVDEAGNESLVNTRNIWSGTDRWGKQSYSITLQSATNVVSNTNKVMSTYYPTDETTGVGTKASFIAPVFRIASSYGQVAVGGRNEARRRCAIYQEAGRPAGRWRVPTEAEIRYIAKLSTERKIPVLLGGQEGLESFGYYWCAQYGLRVNGKGIVEQFDRGDPGKVGNPGNPGCFAVRCVYDEWYWTQIDGTDLPTPLGKLETRFYWGDVKKDNTQAQKLRGLRF